MAWIVTFFTVMVLIALFVAWKMFLIVEQSQTVIKERLGKFQGVLQPGFHFMIPFVDSAAYRNDMREQLLDVPPQSCITRDNIQVEVDGFVYLKVVDPVKAAYGIGDYRQAAINLAQTTMRSEVGKLDLDDTFSERDRINENIVDEIDKASESWGVKVTRYEIMNITPSSRVVDTMEKQMEAERMKRAEITLSTGRKEAQIASSEGKRQEAINLSEGEKFSRIAEADGRAYQIRVRADASADAIDMVASAVREPGGDIATRMKLVEQFIEEMGVVLRKADVTVMPLETAQLEAAFNGLGQLSGVVRQQPQGVKS
jgi:regulator of protease activity HflC (stomatin/prohibitin superfamily)